MENSLYAVNVIRRLDYKSSGSRVLPQTTSLSDGVWATGWNWINSPGCLGACLAPGQLAWQVYSPTLQMQHLLLPRRHSWCFCPDDSGCASAHQHFVSGWLWLRQCSAQQHLVPQEGRSQGDPSPNGGWTPHFLTDLRFSLMSPSSALTRFLQVPTGSLWASASCAPCDSSLAGMREVGMRKVHGWRFISLQTAADVGLSPLGVGRKGFSWNCPKCWSPHVFQPLLTVS